MGFFTSVSAAVRTRHGRFSGTSARPWLVVTQTDVDRLNRAMLSVGTVGSVRRGESLYYYQPLPLEEGGDIHDALIGPEDLYVRLATTSSVLWEPELAIVWANSKEKGTVPLALDTDIPCGLSTDSSEGVVSVPIRRVEAATDDTMIRRLLLVVVTYDAPYAGTDDPISLRVSTEAGRLADHVITDTPQTDLEIDTANIYEVPVEKPFTKSELGQSAAADIRLAIHGTDKWVPKKIFLFGLDQPSDRPNSVIPLVKLHDPGPLSADPAEGVPFISLPLE